MIDNARHVLYPVATMESYEVQFSGETIRVDDTHVIVGKDFFRIQDISGADVDDTETQVRNLTWVAGCAALVTWIAVVVVVANAPNDPLWMPDRDFWTNLIRILLLLVVGGGIGGAGAGWVVLSVLVACGFTDHWEYVRTFRLYGKNGAVLLTLSEVCATGYNGSDRYKKECQKNEAGMKRMVAEIERRL